MRRMIFADLGRILKKIGFYIPLAVNFVLIMVRWIGDSAAEQLETAQTSAGFLGIILPCAAIFSAVYGDELKCGSIQAVIGRGLQRSKVVFGKLLDSAILLLLSNLLFYLAELFKILIAPQLGVSLRQMAFLLLFYVFIFLRSVGYIAFGALFLFLSDSIASGMVILLICSSFGKLFFQWAQNKTRLPLYDLSYDGLLERSCNVFQNGGFGWQLFPALIVFVFGSTLLTILIFERKELSL